jgi:hypothetical protein
MSTDMSVLQQTFFVSTFYTVLVLFFSLSVYSYISMLFIFECFLFFFLLFVHFIFLVLLFFPCSSLSSYTISHSFPFLFFSVFFFYFFLPNVFSSFSFPSSLSSISQLTELFIQNMKGFKWNLCSFLTGPCGPQPLFNFLIYSQSVGLLGWDLCSLTYVKYNYCNPYGAAIAWGARELSEETVTQPINTSKYNSHCTAMSQTVFRDILLVNRSRERITETFREYQARITATELRV